MSVRDDGAGFDTRGVPMRARGLAGMRFRVASHGGRLDLTSQPGRGTTIEAQLPQSARRASGQRAGQRLTGLARRSAGAEVSALSDTTTGRPPIVWH